MSIKVESQIIRTPFEVKLERVCSNCGYAWKAIYKDEYIMENPDTSFSPSIYSNIIDDEIEKMIKKYDNNRELECPKCSHLAKHALMFYFPKGIAKGLLKRYMSETWKNLYFGIPGAIIFGIITALILGGIFKCDAILCYLMPFIVFVLIALIFIASFIYNMAIYFSLKKVLKHSKDKELNDLVIEYYKVNKNSLSKESNDLILNILRKYWRKVKKNRGIQ